MNPTCTVKWVKELIAFAAARPGQVTFASGGAGGGQHLAGELFASMANLKLTHIPYKGSAPAPGCGVDRQQAVIGFTDMLITLPHVKSGKFRRARRHRRSPLSDDHRFADDSESGLPGFSVYAWFGLLAPATTPAEIVTRISAEIQKGFKTPQMRERFPPWAPTRSAARPEQFAAFLKVEMAKWAKLVKAAGIHAE